MAITATALLALTAARPGITASMAVFAAVGAAGVYQLTANTAFVEATPPHARARALGIAAGGLVAGQGLAFALTGWAVQATAPATVTAIAGIAGALAACSLTITWRRLPPPG